MCTICVWVCACVHVCVHEYIVLHACVRVWQLSIMSTMSLCRTVCVCVSVCVCVCVHVASAHAPLSVNSADNTFNTPAHVTSLKPIQSMLPQWMPHGCISRSGKIKSLSVTYLLNIDLYCCSIVTQVRFNNQQVLILLIYALQYRTWILDLHIKLHCTQPQVLPSATQAVKPPRWSATSTMTCLNVTPRSAPPFPRDKFISVMEIKDYEVLFIDFT